MTLKVSDLKIGKEETIGPVFLPEKNGYIHWNHDLIRLNLKYCVYWIFYSTTLMTKYSVLINTGCKLSDLVAWSFICFYEINYYNYSCLSLHFFTNVYNVLVHIQM